MVGELCTYAFEVLSSFANGFYPSTILLVLLFSKRTCQSSSYFKSNPVAEPEEPQGCTVRPRKGAG